MRLERWGWSPYFQALFAEFPEHEAGRVVRAARGRCSVLAEDGERGCVGAAVVGDWVALKGKRIEAVLERRTRFSRKRAGEVTAEQVLAANVDVAFLVSGLDRDHNLNRLERYLTLTWESGARPVVVLNKADLAEDLGGILRDAEEVAFGAPMVALSALTGDGLDALSDHIKRGETAVLLGSSGVGKSTILNRLLGDEVQRTGEVRASDSRGRHTTTRRELIPMPSGWLLIDTPGLRELQLWGSSEGLRQAFPEIGELSARCRFRDCAHQGEPGCAVRESMAERRLENYRKLRGELNKLERKQEERRQHRIYRKMKHRRT